MKVEKICAKCWLSFLRDYSHVKAKLTIEEMTLTTKHSEECASARDGLIEKVRESFN